ncbi:MAG: DNA-3-methyladenine glycosylase [Opitutaceae bacterium]|jgi:DNA-3-methyladenine glycosylase|nr:DNA-3-methyladenine glycosylase [Opitutaceae bacterium]
MSRVLRPSDFAGADTPALARGLLGRRLVAVADGRRAALRITETEAYHGPDDSASHASRGRTPRAQVMFGPPGRWYVYLCYGVHELLNIVTGPEDFPAAVLIRGVETLEGPGRLTRALGIGRRFNALPATRATGLWIEDDGFAPDAREVSATPRVGVAYAASPWREKPWRFVWKPARVS